MKKRSTKVLTTFLPLAVLFCILIAGLFGFWFWHQTWLTIDPLAVNLSEPSQRTIELVKLNAKTIANATEITDLSSPVDSGGIVNMIQVGDNSNLLVVYSKGTFRRWDLNLLRSVAEFDFLAANPRGVNFNADGSLVITPGIVMTAAEINGYKIWNTRTGEMVDCAAPNCPEGWNDLDIIRPGFGLTPNGRWIIDYLGSLIGANGLKLRISGSWNVDSDPYDTSDLTISRIAFDSTGSYIACATEEDRLYVFDIENLFNPTGRTNEDILAGKGNGEGSVIQVRSRQYGKYNPDAHIITATLLFDDTRTRLAQLTGKDLVVWNLRKVIFPQEMRIPVDGGTGLAMNHTGNLLAVGTNKGILLFDLENRKQVASFDVGKVMALYFSHDDRLLIWGDSHGVVHLWGFARKS